ncbi:MAG: hypothetical protein ABJE95_29050 [Byssovorax sp.]
MVLLRLADEVQTFADSIAASFSYFQGLMQPLLRRVAAELVAVAMNTVLDEIQTNTPLPEADLTREACRFYDQRQPRAAVGDQVLRRLILRYGNLEERTKINKARQATCVALDTAACTGKKGVCKDLEEQVKSQTVVSDMKPPSQSEQQRSTEEASKPPSPPVGPRDLPAAPTPEAKLNKEHIAEMAKQFDLMLASCLKEKKDATACSADRVASAAGYAYVVPALLVHSNDADATVLTFSQVDKRLREMEDNLGRRRRNETPPSEAATAGGAHDDVVPVLVDLLKIQQAAIKEAEARTAKFAEFALKVCPIVYEKARQSRSKFSKSVLNVDVCAPDAASAARGGEIEVNIKDVLSA